MASCYITVSQEQKLCKQCAGITLTLPVNKTLIREYPDVKTLEASAEKGCALCIMICNSHSNQHAAWKKRQNRFIEYVNHSQISVYHWVNDAVDLESNIRWECSQEGPRASQSIAGDLGGFFTNSGMLYT
jgi:hypothetical protein